MTDAQQHPQAKHWNDDVLGRKGLADFLTASLTGETQLLSGAGRSNLTVALDADWGSGKSFFLRHWAEDLRVAGYPVVFFDAWENDIGDEASVALMARIKNELDEWISRLPKKKSIQQKALNATSDAIKGLRRAVAPATRVIATGLIKKFTGVAVDELIELGQQQEENTVATRAFDASSDALESGLDELFKRALDEHQRRGTAINDFKKRITEVVDLLVEAAGAKIPVFVLIDEVDRCRPTYAIKLLEETKHIFGMPKICFVVSTNLSQLQESVRAIYGSGFDGHRYLKRFFDHQYTLPNPDNARFSEQLLSEPSALSSRRIEYGLPATQKNTTTQQAIATIADAFALDLRSQKQVFLTACAVAAAIPSDKKIFILWLYFLCGLQHRSPHLLDELQQKNVDHARFTAICREVFKSDAEITYAQPNRDAYDRTPTKRKKPISEILWNYYGWSQEDLLSLKKRALETNMYDYPSCNVHAIAEEAPNPFNPTQTYRPSISQYLEWVKYAGMPRAEQSTAE